MDESKTWFDKLVAWPFGDDKHWKCVINGFVFATVLSLTWWFPILLTIWFSK